MVAGPLFSIYNTHKLFSFVVTAQPSSKSPLSPVQISLPKKTWFHHGLLAEARGRDHVGHHPPRNLLLEEALPVLSAHGRIRPAPFVVCGAEDGEAVRSRRSLLPIKNSLDTHQPAGAD